jgi:hypothetical protein
MTRGVPSLFRDDLDFGKRRCGSTNLNTGRVVKPDEVRSLPHRARYPTELSSSPETPHEL